MPSSTTPAQSTTSKNEPAGSGPFAPVVAWCGGAIFLASLFYFLYCYASRFGNPALSDPSTLRAVVINVVLFSVFALHHSLFARQSMKARVRPVVGPALERSLYTWIASVLFIVVCAAWQPVPGQLYQLTGLSAAIGYAIQAIGIGLTVRSSAKLDVLDLAGIRQVIDARHGIERAHVPLETGGLYGLVRHPLYFGWALFVFAAPQMTMTRFVFAAVSTAYLAAAIPFEERSLVETFGGEYEDYRRRVRWRMVPYVY